MRRLLVVLLIALAGCSLRIMEEGIIRMISGGLHHPARGYSFERSRLQAPDAEARSKEALAAFERDLQHCEPEKAAMPKRAGWTDAQIAAVEATRACLTRHGWRWNPDEAWATDAQMADYLRQRGYAVFPKQ